MPSSPLPLSARGVLHGMNTPGPSVLLRLNKLTGRTVWRVERPTTALRVA
jgi:hypothetical protein